MKFHLLVFLTFALVGCTTGEKESMIDRGHIREVINANAKSFLKCYQSYLKNNGKSEGKIVMRWDVNDKGTVENARVHEDQLKIDSVSKCMVDQVSAMKFQPTTVPKGQIADIIFPWVFRLKSSIEAEK